MILEAAHLNLHHSENFYGHGWKPFHGSHTTLKEMLFAARCRRQWRSTAKLFCWVQWNNKIVLIKNEGVQCIMLYNYFITVDINSSFTFPHVWIVYYIKMTVFCCRHAYSRLVEHILMLWLVNLDHVLTIWLSSKVKFEPWLVSAIIICSGVSEHWSPD